MLFVWCKKALLWIGFFLACAALAVAQVNPHIGIKWPPGCQYYNAQSNVCASAPGAVQPVGFMNTADTPVQPCSAIVNQGTFATSATLNLYQCIGTTWVSMKGNGTVNSGTYGLPASYDATGTVVGPGPGYAKINGLAPGNGTGVAAANAAALNAAFAPGAGYLGNFQLQGPCTPGWSAGIYVASTVRIQQNFTHLKGLGWGYQVPCSSKWQFTGSAGPAIELNCVPNNGSGVSNCVGEDIDDIELFASNATGDGVDLLGPNNIANCNVLGGISGGNGGNNFTVLDGLTVWGFQRPFYFGGWGNTNINYLGAFGATTTTSSDALITLCGAGNNDNHIHYLQAASATGLVVEVTGGYNTVIDQIGDANYNNNLIKVGNYSAQPFGGTTATASCSLTGSTPSCVVGTPGTGYDQEIVVTLTGQTCTGTLIGYATVANGAVQTVTLGTFTSGIWGPATCTVAPTAVAFGGSGSFSKGTLTVGTLGDTEHVTGYKSYTDAQSSTIIQADNCTQGPTYNIGPDHIVNGANGASGKLNLTTVCGKPQNVPNVSVASQAAGGSLTPGTTYYFFYQGVNGSWYSKTSSVASVTLTGSNTEFTVTLPVLGPNYVGSNVQLCLYMSATLGSVSTSPGDCVATGTTSYTFTTVPSTGAAAPDANIPLVWSLSPYTDVSVHCGTGIGGGSGYASAGYMWELSNGEYENACGTTGELTTNGLPTGSIYTRNMKLHVAATGSNAVDGHYIGYTTYTGGVPSYGFTKNLAATVGAGNSYMLANSLQGNTAIVQTGGGGAATAVYCTDVNSNTTVTGCPAIVQAAAGNTPFVAKAGGDTICAVAADTTAGAWSVTGVNSAATYLQFTGTAAPVSAFYPGALVQSQGQTTGAYNGGPWTVCGLPAGGCPSMLPTSTTVYLDNTSNPGAGTAGGTLSLYCSNRVTDAIAASSGPNTVNVYPMAANYFSTHDVLSLRSIMQIGSSSAAPGLNVRLYKGSVNLAILGAGVAGLVGNSATGLKASNVGYKLITLGNPLIVSTSVDGGSFGSTAYGFNNYNPAPLQISNVSENVGMDFFWAATGVASATYVSGGSFSGTGNCTLGTFNNSSTATATIAVSSGTPGAITITARGQGATAAPTTAVVSTGSATCSGTITITSVLGGAYGNWVTLNALEATTSF